MRRFIPILFSVLCICAYLGIMLWQSKSMPLAQDYDSLYGIEAPDTGCANEQPILSRHHFSGRYVLNQHRWLMQITDGPTENQPQFELSQDGGPLVRYQTVQRRPFVKSSGGSTEHWVYTLRANRHQFDVVLVGDSQYVGRYPLFIINPGDTLEGDFISAQPLANLNAAKFWQTVEAGTYSLIEVQRMSSTETGIVVIRQTTEGLRAWATVGGIEGHFESISIRPNVTGLIIQLPWRSGPDTLRTFYSYNKSGYYNSTTALNRIGLNTLPLLGLSQRREMIEQSHYQPPMVDKPVIYLYPEQPTEVHVRVNPVGDFVATEPAYPATGWRVTAYPSGQLIELSSGREYPYLFWEALATGVNWQIEEGFCVATDTLNGFLQNQLRAMGLQPAEYEECAAYWHGRFRSAEFVQVHFAYTETSTEAECQNTQGQIYNAWAPLWIHPEPQSIARVFLLFQTVPKYTPLPTQLLPRFSRQGYHVLEWGGTVIGNTHNS